MLKKILLFCTILFCTDLLCNDFVFAYTYNKTTVGVLTVDIEKPDVMRKLNEPLEIKTVLKNNGNTPLKLKLTYSTIETIEFVSQEQNKKLLIQISEVPAKSEKTVSVAVIGKTGTLSVHYPVYLTAEWEAEGVQLKASVVQPFESTITPNPNWQTGNPQFGQLIENVTDLILNTIPDQTGLVFADLLNYRAFWISDKEINQDKNNVHFLPVGWNGSDSVSAATVTRQSFTRNSVTRRTINMHPPYRNGAGIVGVEYRIKLQQTSPITFSCYGAMRDVALPEPPTDGVTFKIVAVDGQQEKIVAEKHVAETTWQFIEADLTSFAGKEILLRLISDPGPKRNTTCDSCYWGDPVLFAGKKPTFAVPELFAERQSALFKECFATMKTGKEFSKRTKIFPLDGGLRAVVTFGEHGFIDGKIALGSPEKFVVYNGVKVSVKENPIAAFPTTLAAEKWISDKKSETNEQNINKQNTEKYSWTQNIAIGNEKAVMKYSLRKNGTAIQLSVDCSEPAWISSVELGTANEAAERVYFAHGYCVVKPKRFVMGADGQRLSTSHVGFEYPSGIAVLQATTSPPINLTIDPEQKIATMVIRPGTTMTLLPGVNGMFDCAVRYRPLNPKKAAPGVKTKAGRFCFDIWGGSYKRHNEIIDHAIQYGLTDSLFIVHGWQRYGYDNRLPDIWPPDTKIGTLDEMQEALKKCDEAGILYGLHDNYIDFYPDAEGYNLDLLSFERNGQPRKAWLNRGIDARSYQFRPDKFKPFLQRNLDLMIPELPQSCYFVDVFSSMTTVDFYDRNGKFHSRSETQQYWGECFDIIRERLTEASRPRQKLSEEKRNEFYAPTISESGHDFLIGHLDGADCQFGFLSTEPGDFRNHISCEDWERIPWFDAVNHTTFSLHGAGYSGRFEGGRGRLLHGIESDDYITSEILIGHPPMVDLGCATRGAVRKYWLLQSTLRELADYEIDSVEYVDGDIHRQKIVWKSPDKKRETVVYVNRSEKDWTLPDVDNPISVANKRQLVLPPFGFLAKGFTGIASICRTDEGGVAEFFMNDSKLYVNARQQTAENLLPIRVGLKQNSFRYLGENRFQSDILWTVRTSPTLDYSIFVHLVPETWKSGNDRKEGIKADYGVHKPKPVTEWNGEIVTPMVPASIADDIPAGKYRLLIGMYDSKGNGHRARLLEYDNDNCRYCIGILNIIRDENGKISDLTLEEDKPFKGIDAELHRRLMPPQNPFLCGNLLTKGAFLLEGNTLTPLPNEQATEVSLLIPVTDKTKIVAVDSNGKKIRDVPSVHKNGFLIFTTEKDEFQYVIE